MATILINVSKKKFNKFFTVYENSDFHIVNESARKSLCNLFDALGNISNYNDYNVFVGKHSGFTKFKKCTISKYLKTPLEMGQGILVVVDNNTSEIMLPTKKQLKWFLEKYQYSTINTIVSDTDDNTDDDTDDNTDSESRELLTKEVKPVTVEEVKPVPVEEVKPVTVEEVKPIPVTVEVKPVVKSSGFWRFFGWN
jgi:hypothetical protein